MLPQKIKRRKEALRFRCPSHIRFVRSHACCRCGKMENIEVAHVRCGTDGGMSMKPGDYWTISLCGGTFGCHGEQHRIGEPEFEKRYGIDMKALAREFVKASPKRRELEAARDA